MTLMRDTRRQARGCCDKNLVGYNLIFFTFKIHSFICFWLCWVFVAAWRLSLVVASRGSSLVCGLLIAVASLVVEHHSVVMEHYLSCHKACGIFPALAGRFPTTGSPAKSWAILL